MHLWKKTFTRQNLYELVWTKPLSGSCQESTEDYRIMDYVRYARKCRFHYHHGALGKRFVLESMSRELVTIQVLLVRRGNT